ncbi:MAG: glycosyltransferase [Candidatus Sumerlaeia bacterium]|nr:glycosyltransferase [Candidatus Sumerlaeia bacterium]
MSTARTTPKRAVFVFPSFGRGGAELQALQLARGLRERGWRVAIATLSEENPLAERAAAAGFRLAVVPAGLELPKRSPRFWLAFARGVWRLAALLRRERATVVQSFLVWSDPVALLAGLLAGTPVSATCRLQLPGSLPQGAAYRILPYLLAPLTDRVMANAVAVERAVLAREPLSEPRLHVIPNALPDGFRDLSGVVPAALPPQLADASPLVLAVGNLRAVKRHDLLVEACADILPRFPKLALVLVGEDRGERRRLESLARRRGLAERLHFAGDCADVRPWLRRADLLAHPSDAEGLPNAVLEAMAAALPVVATRVGGVPELLEHGRTGWLVPKGNRAAIARALAHLVERPALRAKLGGAARERALSGEFTVARLALRHERMYASALRRSRRRFAP